MVKLDFEGLCPTITTNEDSGNHYEIFACHQESFDNRPDLFESPSAGEHFSYWNNGVFYFFSSDGKSIEACNWADDENEETTNDYLTCQDEKRNLGEFTSYQLGSGESVWLYPVLDYDNKITTEYKLVLKSDGSTYNVNTDVRISAEIETYSPFNWDAYKKIFTEFTTF